SDGTRLEGSFIDSFLYGNGSSYSPKGDQYHGNYRNNQMFGYGIYSFANGDNMFNGFGTYSLANGDKYFEHFYNGEKDGSGSVHYLNGNKFEGNFINDK
ncbi:unnamed protein product, partial [Adineta steineri]